MSIFPLLTCTISVSFPIIQSTEGWSWKSTCNENRKLTLCFLVLQASTHHVNTRIRDFKNTFMIQSALYFGSFCILSLSNLWFVALTKSWHLTNIQCNSERYDVITHYSSKLVYSYQKLVLSVIIKLASNTTFTEYQVHAGKYKMLLLLSHKNLAKILHFTLVFAYVSNEWYLSPT